MTIIAAHKTKHYKQLLHCILALLLALADFSSLFSSVDDNISSARGPTVSGLYV